MGYKPGSHFMPASRASSPSIRLSRRSIRALLYLLGFLGLVTFLATLEGPRRVSASLHMPLQNPLLHKDSIIGTGEVTPLTKPSHKLAPLPSTFNPLSESTPLTHGPWTAHFPSIIAINQPFRLRIECSHDDLDLCPSSYAIQFYGPTATSVPVTGFTKIAPRTIEAAMVLHEQGNYQVYAWPTYPNCSKLQDEPDVAAFTKQAVSGTPHMLSAHQGPIPSTRNKLDVHRVCGSFEEVIDGRWIDHDRLEPEMKAAYSYGQFHPSQAAIEGHARYVYSPYGCKIPHRSFEKLLEEIPTLRHILVIGGSAARGYMCSRALPELFGDDEDVEDMAVCKQHPGMSLLERSSRLTTRTHHTRQGRKVEVSFAYVGGRFGDAVRYLDKLSTAPQVIIFDVGNFADDMSDEVFTEHHEAAFEYFQRHWAGAHVLVRSAASVVQPLHCAEDSEHTREAAWRKRQMTLDLTKAWVAKLKKDRESKMDDLELEDSDITRVSFVDAYTITDSRPESCMDGFHWAYPAPSLKRGFLGWSVEERPTVGETEDMLLDWMWDEVVSRRSLVSN